MSANTVGDLGNIAPFSPSISPTNGVDSSPASGVMVGMIADLRDFNNLTNMLVGFGPSISGGFRVSAQTSDSTASGTFTDPTSGLAVMPTDLLSGGILLINSGNTQRSGGFMAGGFLRPHRYARLLVLSGDLFNAPFVGGFACQPKRTGSGDGFSQSPALGTSGFGGVGGF